jgi:hypothetical protein
VISASFAQLPPCGAPLLIVIVNTEEMLVAIKSVDVVVMAVRYGTLAGHKGMNVLTTWVLTVTSLREHPSSRKRAWGEKNVMGT